MQWKHARLFLAPVVLVGAKLLVILILIHLAQGLTDARDAELLGVLSPMSAIAAAAIITLICAVKLWTAARWHRQMHETITELSA